MTSTNAVLGGLEEKKVITTCYTCCIVNHTCGAIAQEENLERFWPETLLVGFISSNGDLVGGRIFGRHVSPKSPEKWYPEARCDTFTLNEDRLKT